MDTTQGRARRSTPTRLNQCTTSRTDYTVTFAPAELTQLAAIFPLGVCDFSKPGTEQVPLQDTRVFF